MTRLVFRIAEQQERMQPVPQTRHIENHIVTQPAPELQAGTGHGLGLDQWQGFALLSH
jgi:hypothetical protein